MPFSDATNMISNVLSRYYGAPEGSARISPSDPYSNVDPRALLGAGQQAPSGIERGPITGPMSSVPPSLAPQPTNYENWIQNILTGKTTYPMAVQQGAFQRDPDNNQSLEDYIRNPIPTTMDSPQWQRDLSQRMQWGRLPQATNIYEQFNPFYQAQQDYAMTDRINQMFGTPSNYSSWANQNLQRLRQPTPERLPGQDYMGFRNYLDQILNPGAYKAPKPNITFKYRRGYGTYPVLNEGMGNVLGGANSAPGYNTGYTVENTGGWANLVDNVLGLFSGDFNYDMPIGAMGGMEGVGGMGGMEGMGFGPEAATEGVGGSQEDPDAPD